MLARSAGEMSYVLARVGRSLALASPMYLSTVITRVVGIPRSCYAHAATCDAKPRVQPQPPVQTFPLQLRGINALHALVGLCHVVRAQRGIIVGAIYLHCSSQPCILALPLRIAPSPQERGRHVLCAGPLETPQRHRRPTESPDLAWMHC